MTDFQHLSHTAAGKDVTGTQLARATCAPGTCDHASSNQVYLDFTQVNTISTFIAGITHRCIRSGSMIGGPVDPGSGYLYQVLLHKVELRNDKP